jgi:hypothetical protein
MPFEPRAIARALIASFGLVHCSAPLSDVSPRPADGTTIIGRLDHWDRPCVVPEGATFTATLDRAIGVNVSTAGETFTARVGQTVSTCDRDVISRGGILRGRVVNVAGGDQPRLALDLIDVDTMGGPMPVSMAIRSAAGRKPIEEDWPFRAFLFDAADASLPAGSEMVVELIKPITVLP